MSRLTELKKQAEFKASVQDRLVRGQMTVKNTGETYSAGQAVKDASNTALRLTFNGQKWVK